LKKNAMVTSRCWTPPLRSRGAQQELRLSQQEGRAAINLALLEHEQEAHRAAILESVGGASNLRNQLTQSEERLAGIGREEQRLQAEIAPPRRNRKPSADSAARLPGIRNRFAAGQRPHR
jgi:hypothetical protein